MNLSLFDIPEHESDVVMTPDWCAVDIIEYFKPSGRVLDPARGDGAFWRHMPGADWCEIREGRDFYAYGSPVDWIVTNPPYNILREFTRHSMTLAENIVFLIPITKVFSSFEGMKEIYEWGAPKTCLVYGTGTVLGFPLGFACGAVHFERGYKGGMSVEFRSPAGRAAGAGVRRCAPTTEKEANDQAQARRTGGVDCK